MLTVWLVGWVFFAYAFPLACNNTYVARQAMATSYVQGGKRATYRKLTNSCFAGYRFQPEIIEGIEQIKAELQKGKNIEDKEWFLNMSSYTFLYKDLDVEPPRGMHLYYHRNVTLFDKDYIEFKDRLKRKPFKYILLQEMASGTPPPEFRDYLTSLGYKALFSVDNPKSGVGASGRGERFNTTLYQLTVK